ncbi:MAG: hypothetical protein E6Q75_11565 [Rheinheimera sp.]|nr:MAG: hypothetical protein E6Q75_11565 [Rheinheimera sp.]
MKIEIMEDDYYSGSISSESDAFKKWMKIKYPDIEILVPENKSRFDLHDKTLIMPLVTLLADMSLINYLNLVLEYANFYFRGSLKSDLNEVSLRVSHRDPTSGIVKEFEFKGSEDALEKCIKKIDVNKLMG